MRALTMPLALLGAALPMGVSAGIAEVAINVCAEPLSRDAPVMNSALGPVPADEARAAGFNGDIPVFRMPGAEQYIIGLIELPVTTACAIRPSQSEVAEPVADAKAALLAFELAEGCTAEQDGELVELFFSTALTELGRGITVGVSSEEGQVTEIIVFTTNDLSTKDECEQ